MKISSSRHVWTVFFLFHYVIHLLFMARTHLSIREYGYILPNYKSFIKQHH